MATLTEKGQVVIPASIRRKYGLIPGTKVDFVDDGVVTRLHITRPAVAITVDEGFGLIRLPDSGRSRRLSGLDAAELVRRT